MHQVLSQGLLGLCRLLPDQGTDNKNHYNCQLYISMFEVFIAIFPCFLSVSITVILVKYSRIY